MARTQKVQKEGKDTRLEKPMSSYSRLVAKQVRILQDIELGAKPEDPTLRIHVRDMVDEALRAILKKEVSADQATHALLLASSNMFARRIYEVVSIPVEELDDKGLSLQVQYGKIAMAATGYLQDGVVKSPNTNNADQTVAQMLREATAKAKSAYDRQRRDQLEASRSLAIITTDETNVDNMPMPEGFGTA